MRILKRSGVTEEVRLDKITERIQEQIDRLSFRSEVLDAVKVAMKVCESIKDGITTSELDEVTARICMNWSLDHTDWGVLGSRVIVNNHRKNVRISFCEAMKQLYLHKDVHGKHAPLISEDLYELINLHWDEINSIIVDERDYLIDYFGFKTLERSYLMRTNGKIVETPQYMWMRVALGIWEDDFDRVKTTYDLMSQKYFTHATPTLFHMGSSRMQNVSCFLLGTDDSLEGIFKTITDCAKISKWAGGIGIHISNIRANNSYIRKTGGYADGILPMLKVYNEVARYINQCFVPETPIYTKNGYKTIENIKEKVDEVVTRDGSFQKVNKVIKNKINKKIREIKTTYSLEPVLCTDEHEICVLRRKKGRLFSKEKELLDKGYTKPEYIPAKDVREGDFMLFPIPKGFKDVEEYSLDLCRLYGIMLCDGHIHIKKRNGLPECGVTLGYEKIKTLRYLRYVLEKMGFNYWECEIHKDSSIGIRWTGTEFPITYDMLYDENKEKRIDPTFLHLPLDKTLKLVRGMMETDGSTLNEYYFHSTSKNLAKNIRYLLLRLGILSSGYTKDDRGKSHLIRGKPIITKKLCYVVRIPKVPLICKEFNMEPCKKFGFFEHNGVLYSHIKYNKEVEYNGYVYDLNIENNHNYLTEMGLVHNSGKRLGSFAIYLEPWHADIFSFLDAKKNHGNDLERARDLFYALWVPDLFMKRVEQNGKWSLMCPDECPGLNDVYGEEFESLYMEYEEQGRYREQINARSLWSAILITQMETGMPYMLYKDSINRKSNQSNKGIIKSSNLCVGGHVKILTDKGEFRIEELVNQKTNVWNGHEWSETVVRKTGTGQKLLSIGYTFTNLKNEKKLPTDFVIRFIECTEYHKFYLKDGREVRAGELKIGDELLCFNHPNFKTEMTPVVEFIDIVEGTFDTFCFTEPLRGMGIFNGLLTGNCAEITEYSDSENTACCNLASINLQAFLKPKPLPEYILVYGKTNCPSCKIVKAMLNERGKEFEYVDLDDDDLRKMFYEKYGVNTVPQVFVKEFNEETGNMFERRIGGFEAFLDLVRPDFDLNMLRHVVHTAVENLDRIIDINYYPTPEGEHSNIELRPIGLGVQGLADLFAKMYIPFCSDEAKKLNSAIFERIQMFAVEKSIELAKEKEPYELFEGSLVSQGLFQHNLWEIERQEKLHVGEINPYLGEAEEWKALREAVQKFGIRNSLLTALMPTASTGQILGSNASMEPFTTNMYVRRTLAGEFIVINPYLLKMMHQMGLYNEEMKYAIMHFRGDVSSISKIPNFVKELFKTAWKMKTKDLIQMSAERGRFVDQSQSFNLFVEEPDESLLTKIHFFGWKSGLKTGQYYLHTKPATNSQTFTIDPDLERKIVMENSGDDSKECLMCSS